MVWCCDDCLKDCVDKKGRETTPIQLECEDGQRWLCNKCYQKRVRAMAHKDGAIKNILKSMGVKPTMNKQIDLIKLLSDYGYARRD